jgi:hypothetical protein
VGPVLTAVFEGIAASITLGKEGARRLGSTSWVSKLLWVRGRLTQGYILVSHFPANKPATRELTAAVSVITSNPTFLLYEVCHVDAGTGA